MVVSLMMVMALTVRAHEKPTWTKKKITDYNDVDMEKLFEQWEVSDSC